MANGQDRISGDYNAFWAERDYLNKIDHVNAAVLMAHGFNDWNVMPQHSVRIYEALNQRGLPVQCYFHQLGHGGDPPLKQMNRWFTRYLYGIENGVEAEPKAWIVRENANASNPTAYPDYPNPEAKMVTLYPAGDGSKIGQLDSSAPGKQPPTAFVDDVNIHASELAKSSSSPHRLLYATPTLKQPLHISGTARVTIRIASSKPAANLSVYLVSLPWTDNARINDNLITRGWADPQNYKSITESEPLIPGEFYELKFDLQPDDQIIPIGQKIGLMIFSSDRDFTLWPQPGTELTLDPLRTTIEIPFVGGKATFNGATTGE
jgi:X-Pro dipeptidyl-peptidase